MRETVIIGEATLHHGDCRELLPGLPMVDAVIVDPPYSDRLHKFHNSNSQNSRGQSMRPVLSYDCLTPSDVQFLASHYHRLSSGWIVWMTDADLALHVRNAMESFGRTGFPPLPFYQPGRSVRLSGDGPSSWTDWICVARTSAQKRWGTLPGGYVAGKGWNDKARVGGKPTFLMDALVSDYSRIGDIVLDSHMGAGTTGVSCAKLGRKFVGIEIDRGAFDVACQRIAEAYAQESLFDHADPIKNRLQDALPMQMSPTHATR